MYLKHAWYLIPALILVFSGMSGCIKEPPDDAVFTMNWEVDQGTWNLNDKEVTMRVLVKNNMAYDLWVSIMPFENDCFSFEGFGSWMAGWSERGKVPADGNKHELILKFEPRGLCQAANYFFWVEARRDPEQKNPVAKFHTDQTQHLGDKKFGVAIEAKTATE